MPDIRIKDLPFNAAPNKNMLLATDLTTAQSSTLEALVLAGRPSASQAEAEAGTEAVKAMTPLTGKQQITAIGLLKQSPVADGILRVGASSYPQPQNSYDTTVSHGSGSVNITVANGSSVENGNSINSVNIQVGAYVLSGGGTNNLVISEPTLGVSTNAAIKFGRDRWDLTSSSLAETGAFNNLFVGTAARGRNTWLSEVLAGGFDYAEIARAVFLNNGGPAALVVGGRASDCGPHWVLPSHNYVLIDQVTPGHGSWNEYKQASLMPGTESLGHINEESSIESFWDTVDINPFNINALGSVRNLRMDAGLGYFTLGLRPKPNDISAFVDFSYNDARARAGIVFGDNSLDADAGRKPPAVFMPPAYSITWAKPDGSVAWEIFSDATSGANFLRLTADSARITSDLGIEKASGVAASFNYYQNGVAVWSAQKLTTGDYGISRFNTSGAFQDIPFRIMTGTGHIRMDNLAAQPSFANDAAAAEGGIGINELYRNGSQVMIRIT